MIFCFLYLLALLVVLVLLLCWPVASPAHPPPYTTRRRFIFFFFFATRLCLDLDHRRTTTTGDKSDDIHLVHASWLIPIRSYIDDSFYRLPVDADWPGLVAGTLPKPCLSLCVPARSNQFARLCRLLQCKFGPNPPAPVSAVPSHAWPNIFPCGHCSTPYVPFIIFLLCYCQFFVFLSFLSAVLLCLYVSTHYASSRPFRVLQSGPMTVRFCDAIETSTTTTTPQQTRLTNFIRRRSI